MFAHTIASATSSFWSSVFGSSEGTPSTPLGYELENEEDEFILITHTTQCVSCTNKATWNVGGHLVCSGCLDLFQGDPGKDRLEMAICQLHAESWER